MTTEEREDLLYELRLAATSASGGDLRDSVLDALILAAVSPWIRVTKEHPGPRVSGIYLVTVQHKDGSRIVDRWYLYPDLLWHKTGRVIAHQPLPPPMEDTP